MGRDNIRYEKQTEINTNNEIFSFNRDRKFLSTSGDKMLTLFEDLKSSGAEAHLVEVSKYYCAFATRGFQTLFFFTDS